MRWSFYTPISGLGIGVNERSTSRYSTRPMGAAKLSARPLNNRRSDMPLIVEALSLPDNLPHPKAIESLEITFMATIRSFGNFFIGHAGT